MSAQVANPVAHWLSDRALVSQTPPHFLRAIAVVNSYCRNSKDRRTGEIQNKLKEMSDADTEGSAHTCRSEDAERKYSITSSESDGGPQIVVHTTSVEDDDDDTEVLTCPPSPYFLSVSGIDSVNSTDIGSDYTSEGGDSSYEVEVREVTPEIKASLVKQLEEYLSDEGLANDLFLLKHVKRHRDGFVSLKLLSGYKKVKKISRDWRVLALALRESTKLTLNEEGTKVKRQTPLPSALLYDAPSSRAIVAVNVPSTQTSMGSLATLFGAYGGVASLQVIRPKPGGGVPSELQSLLIKLPEIATTTSAIIEYEDVWGAAKALRELTNPPMTLHVLRRTKRGERASAHSSRTSPIPTLTLKGRTSSRCENGVQADELRHRLQGDSSSFSSARKYHRDRHRESSASDGEEGANNRRSWRMGPRLHSPQPSFKPHYRRPMGSSMSNPCSPVLLRRAQQLQQKQQPKQPLKLTQVGVLRTPRGPDGTKGFARGIS